MATRLNPYLTFDGTARQAMEFYRDVFGGELTLNTYGEFGAPDSPIADKVMHAMLVSDDLALMGADVPPDQEHRPGNTVSISLSGDDGDTLRRWWAALSDGGAIAVPLERQMWGDEFGMCVDRFGTAWMVNISSPQV